MKKKILLFQKALAPYVIDLYNGLNDEFEAKTYFFRKRLLSQKFDMSKLESQLNFTPEFITSGIDFQHKGRMIRFGFLRKIILHKPDIILCWEYNIITFITALFTKIFFPKTKVYTFCDDSVEIAINTFGLRRIGRKLCFIFLDGTILCNDPAEKWYNQKFPKVRTTVFPIIQKEERIITIINRGQQITNNYIQQYNLQAKNVLLFVGRLTNVKNLKFLITVFSEYVAANKDAILVLVGDGDQKTALIEQVNQLQMQENIIFAGRFENEELYAWYHTADYFILPSTYEPFGAVVNEALIAGIPVICSNIAGSTCLINKNNGVIFNPNDKEELLSIFKSRLSKSKSVENKPRTFNSLMPFTFNQRLKELILFLNSDNSN